MTGFYKPPPLPDPEQMEDDSDKGMMFRTFVFRQTVILIHAHKS